MLWFIYDWQGFHHLVICAKQISPPTPINLHKWAWAAHHKKDNLFVELTLKNLNKNVDIVSSKGIFWKKLEENPDLVVYAFRGYECARDLMNDPPSRS